MILTPLLLCQVLLCPLSCRPLDLPILHRLVRPLLHRWDRLLPHPRVRLLLHLRDRPLPHRRDRLLARLLLHLLGRLLDFRFLHNHRLLVFTPPSLTRAATDVFLHRPPALCRSQSLPVP